MNISYSSSKAVKINNEMRNDLNVYNQRKVRIDNYSKEIEDNLKEINDKNQEIASLQSDVNSGRESREAARRIKILQKEVDRLLTTNDTLESRKRSLSMKQQSASSQGTIIKDFPDNNSIESAQTENGLVGEYKSDESFVPTDNEVPVVEESKLSNDDIEAIWNGLHKYDGEENEENISPVSEPTIEPEIVEPVTATEPETTVPEVTEIPEVSPEVPEVKEVTEPEPVTPIYDEETQFEPIYEEPTVIEPIVIPETEEPVDNTADNTISTEENEAPADDEVVAKDKLEKDIHEEVNNEFPEITVPEPMDSEEKLNSIYKELDVEPKLPEESKVRDLKNLTLFIDYNDYTFAFAQQHYNKEAIKPEELDKLIMVKSYLSEKDFNNKRTTQYGKITAENKRLNKKIISLSKEFTRTIDKLSKEYVHTTEELTDQTIKAKEQIEVDRVEKVQTQKLNKSLTDNIKEQASHIEDLISENTGLKETIETKDKNIKDLEKEVSDQAEKIKVFEEKLNTVLGIVKEVKGEKKNKA